MEISYDYFKKQASRDKRALLLDTYVTGRDRQASAMVHLTPVPDKGSAHVATPYGLFRVGAGNSKVHFPTINFESGLTCSSQDACPFAFRNKRASADLRHPLCYAQKLEGAYPGMFVAKTYQSMVCQRIAEGANGAEQQAIAEAVAAATAGFGSKYVRLSEVGDIGPVVAPFAIRVIAALGGAGMKPYLYTKRPEPEYRLFREAGAVVVVSETDFVCVQSKEDAAAKGLPVCPGECGGPVHRCYRCPLGKKTAVVAH